MKLETDGDGKIDIVYFIDDDPKNQAEFRSIVVNAIDQDGDMDRDRGADVPSRGANCHKLGKRSESSGRKASQSDSRDNWKARET